MTKVVIGPIEELDWDVMIQLRRGLHEMRKDIKTYKDIIQEETILYKKYLNKYIS